MEANGFKSIWVRCMLSPPLKQWEGRIIIILLINIIIKSIWTNDHCLSSSSFTATETTGRWNLNHNNHDCQDHQQNHQNAQVWQRSRSRIRRILSSWVLETKAWKMGQIQKHTEFRGDRYHNFYDGDLYDEYWRTTWEPVKETIIQRWMWSW